MKEGSYGLCLSCGEEIQRERLEVVPHTRYCVSCKDKNN
ncbi:MAG: TraR/DksA family transcriptional regulator [bacterium]